MGEYPAHHECPKCGHLCAFTPRPDTQHWGEIRCPIHAHRWIPKPAEDRKPRRKTNECLKHLLPEGMRSYCWKCLREEDHLKALRPSVCLQVHHIIEIKNGGTDAPANLQLVCAECHADIHRRRELIARYVTS
jgi:5-methylcytosine-specific restriction endonuclease McrA